MSASTAPTLPADKIIVDPDRVLTDGWWLFFDSIAKMFRTGTTIGSGAVALTDVTLTGAATVNSPGTPADGAFWIARIKQDATGGRAVTWGPNIMLGPMIDVGVNSDPNTMCDVAFYGRGGKWYPLGMPIMAVPIV